MSWVRPGVLLTKARRRRPASVLMALDFPALERPANAISGLPAPGSSRGSWTDIEKVAAARGKSSFAPLRLATEPPPTLKLAAFPPFLPLPLFSSRGS
jgi:hypothetical protein